MSTPTGLEYVSFGDVARKQLGMQCQYARKYLLDPEIANGIRWTGEVNDYHGLMIHTDDVETFVTRAIAWRKAHGIIT